MLEATQFIISIYRLIWRQRLPCFYHAFSSSEIYSGRFHSPATFFDKLIWATALHSLRKIADVDHPARASEDEEGQMLHTSNVKA